MFQPEDLRNLRTASPDYAETQALKAALRNLRGARSPFFLTFLTGGDFDKVFRWKLRSQYGRQAQLRERNSDDSYRAVSEAVFKIAGPDLEYECDVRLGLLIALPGIGVPVASAILALVDPDRYCVIDFRGWRSVFNEERRDFSIGDYLSYRAEVERLANDLGWPIVSVHGPFGMSAGEGWLRSAAMQACSR